MADTTRITINGESKEVTSSPDTPLLYVLADELGLKGPRFGCGLAQCGACSVLLDGQEVRACVFPLSAVGEREVTTLEGLPAWHAKANGGDTSDPAPHPVQTALIDEQAPQCGYCYNGIVIKAAELLAQNASPSDEEIVEWMDGHLCRCGTYPRIMAAIRRAADEMEG
jgi:aerobic-type carbon monoxide dehydrogenase small subunit (CoxS/CutS family)